MKKSFVKHLVVTSCFLVLAAGCGKTSGSKSSTGVGIDPLTGLPYNTSGLLNYQNLNTTGVQAITNLNAWYTSVSEGGIPSIGQHIITRSVTSYNTSSNCKTFLGFLNMCYSGSTGGNTTQSSQIINVLASQAKSSNPKLVEIFSGQSGTISQASQSNTVYNVEFVKTDGSRVSYIIDTSYNSALNPVVIYDTNANTKDVVSAIQ